jgi:hypothetical protein
LGGSHPLGLAVPKEAYGTQHQGLGMNDFFRTPLGGAILGAIAIPLGMLIFGQIGWMDEPDTLTWVLGAIAGFVGGWFGAARARRRRNERSDANT